jgi:hypothetical protein
MTKAENKEMRDIRSDLQDRADWIGEQIKSERNQFEIATAQLRKDQTNRLEDLGTQLQAVTRLLELATWHHNVRMATARALALAATAEIATGQFTQAQVSQAQVSQAPDRSEIHRL